MEATSAPRPYAGHLARRSVRGASQRGLSRRDKSGGCYLVHAGAATEDQVCAFAGFAPAHSGRWRNASIRPVLKHGPRSLTRMRAGGWQTHEAQVT
jgi:hypothetical protein